MNFLLNYFGSDRSRGFHWRSPISVLPLTVFLLAAGLSEVQTTQACVCQEKEGGNSVEETQAKEEAAKPKREPIYNVDADGAADIERALARAKQENRRVLIQWGGNWCGWCYLLHDMMEQNPRVKKILNYEYDVVLIDIGQMDKHQELVEKYGADLKKNGVPYFTLLDADGSVVINQETASLESKEKDVKGHDEVRVLEFLTAHQPKPWVASDVLAAGQKRAAAENKLVLLHFGAPWCGWCHYMEDWMLEPEVAAVLDKVFVDVKVDIDRMTGGEELKETYCKKPGGIPWFVFLDGKSGDVVTTSDGPEGNLGFPSTDAEIAAFADMLRACTNRFSAEEIEMLTQSLVANRERREKNRGRE